MNRNALYLVASAVLLGSTVIAFAHGIAWLTDAKPRPIDIARATDRELLECYRTGDWPQAFVELKRRAAGYSYKGSTDLAFEMLSVGFRMRPDRGVYTEFFDDCAIVLPKPLANWVQVEGPQRRERFASEVRYYVVQQELRAQRREQVDLARLAHLYDNLKTAEKYPMFWGPHPRCGFDDRFSELLKSDIKRILQATPGGTGALKRLAESE